MRIRLPVRSAIYKHCTGGSVVRWVTTSESPLLYVFDILKPFFACGAAGACMFLTFLLFFLTSQLLLVWSYRAQIEINCLFTYYMLDKNEDSIPGSATY